MKFRARLQLFGLPLVLLPVFATLALNYVLVAKTVRESKLDLVGTKLSLLENRVASAWDVLAKVSLNTDEFFERNARDSLTRYFVSILGPGEYFAIFGEDGSFLGGGESGKAEYADAREGIKPGDPLSMALSGESGTATLKSWAFPSVDDGYIAVWKPFPPWKWVLVVAVDERIVLDSLGAATAASIGLSALFAVLSAIGFVWIAKRVSDPLSRISQLARDLGEGRFDSVDGVWAIKGVAAGGEEIRILAGEFESAAHHLASLTRGLEARVAERTVELERSNAELSGTIRELRATQDQLIAAEKMASLGQLVAGIAHELNTPIGAIAAAGRNLEETMLERWMGIMDLYRGLPSEGASLFRELVGHGLRARAPRDTSEERKARWALETRLAELVPEGSQDAGELAERLVELGADSDEGIIAAVADAPDGPSLVEAAWQLASMERSVRVVALASEKAGKVVRSLKIYSRQEEGELAREVDLRGELEMILTLYYNALKKGVEVVRDYDEVPPVSCRRDRVNQVWVILIDNALYAMSYSGKLGLAVKSRGEAVEVSVSDSGPGIPEELRPRIFSPFFTTKPSGSGTGLGLNIARRIVEEAGGTIGFECAPGRTTFTVRLPLATASDRKENR